MIRASTRIAASAFVLSIGVGVAAEEKAPPAPGVQVDRVSGWQRLHAVLPGWLRSYALPQGEQGRREIVLLIRPFAEESRTPAEAEEGEASIEEPETPSPPPCDEEAESRGRPLALYRIDLSEPTGLRLLHDHLPQDISAVDAADVDGDGRDELLLARDGELFTFDADGENEIESVLQDPSLRWRRFHPRAVRAPDLDGWRGVQIHAYSRLAIHGPGGGGPWERMAGIDLPVAAKVTGAGLRIKSLNPLFIGRTQEGAMLFGTTAEAHGQRVHVRLIEVTTRGDVEVTDSWSRLPGAETVLEQNFLMLDGRPLLFVTTKPANKLNLFGEKRLRLFALERDLSRLGRNPLFATVTRANLWQEITPMLVDVNRDGRDDLVLGYWKGMKDDRVVLDVHPRVDDGWFAKNPHTTAFDVEHGDRSFVEYGRDLTGDGVADLLVRNHRGRLWLHPGLPTKVGKKLVSLEPRELPLDDTSNETVPEEVMVSIGASVSIHMATGARPMLVDLDDDGRDELLVLRAGREKEPGRLLVLSKPGQPPD